MKSLTLGILGAAALAATLLRIRQEVASTPLTLDRIRELGL